MKKSLVFGLVAATAVTSAANAGWWEKLGFGKKTEPQTLEQACNTDELTSICPDMLLGSQTMMGCLSENVTSLSSKCAKFVKKYVTEHKDELVTTATEKVKEVKSDVAEAKAEIKNIKQAAKETKESAKELAKEQKAELKKTAAELKAAAKETGTELKETGNSVKAAF